MWQEDACTRCLYTICRGLSAQHLFGDSMVSIGSIPIGVHYCLDSFHVKFYEILYLFTDLGNYGKRCLFLLPKNI